MRYVFVFPYALPTFKAEGQIAINTCAAFDRLGLDGVLLHPASDPQVHGHLMPPGHPSDYYQMPRRLTLKSYRPSRLRRPQSRVGSLLWHHLAARRTAAVAASEPASFYFTWDIHIAWQLGRRGRKTVYEAASFPPSSIRRSVRRLGLKAPSVVFTAHTEHLVRDLTSSLGLPTGRIKLLRGGVQLRGPMDRMQARAELGLRPDEPIAVYTGGLRKDRGIDVLVDVAARLPRVRFMIVGGLPAEAAAYRSRVQSRQLSNVIVQGHVTPERARLFQAASDVLLLVQSSSSRHLTHYVSPAKAFEYMDAGRPIVASDLPCFREILFDGRNALLVENDSPGDWASAIDKLMRDSSLAERLSGIAAQDVQAHTWDERAKQMLEWLGVEYP
jgi:glycosyltransferase involved in cell wall biosynthesis